MKQQYTTIKEMEKVYIIKALNKALNKKGAAKMLGISERTLYSKIHEYKLN